MIKRLFSVISLSLLLPFSFSHAQGNNSTPEPVNEKLAVLPQDLAVAADFSETREVRGINLYIKKKGDINSVMLVETTKDPVGKTDNFAYRATEYNPVNGDEIRVLDGKVLKSEYSKYTLMSSTVVKHPVLGECFQIYIPIVMVYGYPWTRNGSITVGKGTFINIRSFSKKYGDYTGEFQDNPYMFDFVEPEKSDEVVMTDDYSPVAADSFQQIASFGKGKLIYSKGPDSISDDLVKSLAQLNPSKKADVVFAVDTTGSMDDEMAVLVNEWVPALIKQYEGFSDLQLGLLFYRDYNDDYYYKNLPVKFYAFTKDLNKFSKNLASVRIHGNEGGDKPEAVYEALYASISYFEWREDAQKKVILIGDAEPHPSPRGPKKISQEVVAALSEEKDIVLDCIILPE